jgi:hypothetical protein
LFDRLLNSIKAEIKLVDANDRIFIHVKSIEEHFNILWQGKTFDQEIFGKEVYKLWLFHYSIFVEVHFLKDLFAAQSISFNLVVNLNKNVFDSEAELGQFLGTYLRFTLALAWTC